MAIKQAFIFFTLLTLVTSEQFQTSRVVDAWNGNSFDGIDLSLQSPAPPRVYASNYFITDSAIGGERDIEIIAESGSATANSFVVIDSDSLLFAAPPHMSGKFLIQYDGVDNSIDLNPKGLGGLDLTQNGGNRFHINIENDIAATLEIRVYTMEGESASSFIELPRRTGSDEGVDYYIPFDEFDNDIDFTNVGALEIFIPFDKSLDLIFKEFNIQAPVTILREFIEPIDERIIDYDLRCARPNWNINPFAFESFSTISGTEVLLPSIVLFVISLFLLC